MATVSVDHGFIGVRRMAGIVHALAKAETPRLSIYFRACNVQLDTFYSVLHHHQETNPAIRGKPILLDLERCRFISSFHKLRNVPTNICSLAITRPNVSTTDVGHVLWSLIHANRNTLMRLDVTDTCDCPTKLKLVLEKCLDACRLEHFTLGLQAPKDNISQDDISYVQTWFVRFLCKNIYLRTCLIETVHPSLCMPWSHPDVSLRNIFLTLHPEHAIPMPEDKVRLIGCRYNSGPKLRKLQTVQWARFVLGIVQWTRRLRHAHERAIFDILVGSIFPMVYNLEIVPPECLLLSHNAHVRKLSAMCDCFDNERR